MKNIYLYLGGVVFWLGIAYLLIAVTGWLYGKYWRRSWAQQALRHIQFRISVYNGFKPEKESLQGAWNMIHNPERKQLFKGYYIRFTKKWAAIYGIDLAAEYTDYLKASK